MNKGRPTNELIDTNVGTHTQASHDHNYTYILTHSYATALIFRVISAADSQSDRGDDAAHAVANDYR